MRQENTPRETRREEVWGPGIRRLALSLEATMYTKSKRSLVSIREGERLRRLIFFLPFLVARKLEWPYQTSGLNMRCRMHMVVAHPTAKKEMKR